MATFSVILEDVQQAKVRRAPVIITNKRVETMEADDLQQAWVQARAKYYTGMIRAVDQPQTQIADIVAGEYTLPPEKAVPVPSESEDETTVENKP